MTVTPSPPSDPAVLFHLGGARSTATGSRFRHGFGTADLNLSTLPSWLAMRRSGSSYRTWRAKRTSQTDEAMENDTRRLSPHCAVYARIGGSVSQGPLSLSCGATSVRKVGGPRRRSGNGQFDAGSAIDVCARGAKGLVLVPGGWGRLGSTNVLLAAVTKRLLRARVDAAFPCYELIERLGIWLVHGCVPHGPRPLVLAIRADVRNVPTRCQ
jgi:hypothetical protein